MHARISLATRYAVLAVCSIVAANPGVCCAAVTVVATVFPVGDIVRQIGGEQVDVRTLLPAGANPHTFEPTPEQLRAVASAQLVVRVGAGMDDWIMRLLTSGANIPVVAITDGIELLGPSDSSHGDPHVWLDPILVRDRIVPALVSALTRVAPQEEDDFKRGAAVFSGELTRLDHDASNTLQPLTSRGFVAVHPAWRYFARRYGLDEVAVVEAAPGKEPSAQSIAGIIKRARERHVRAVLTEPQVSDRTATAIAREIGATVVTVDPLGGPSVSSRDSYLALMGYNLRMFGQALR